MPVDELSIGDYVLAGGEAAALVVIEAVARLRPGVLGNACSAGDDSFGGDADSSMAACSRAGLHQAADLAGRRCPTCCCPATTPRSAGGGATRPSAGPSPTGPTSFVGALRDLDRRDRQVLAEVGDFFTEAGQPGGPAPATPRLRGGHHPAEAGIPVTEADQRGCSGLPCGRGWPPCARNRAHYRLAFRLA